MAARSQKPPVPSITGDASAEEVRLNKKGGSVTAVLKKQIRGGLAQGTRAFGARLDFANDVNCLLVAPAGMGKVRGKNLSFRVTRVSPDRFMVDLVGGKATPKDAQTGALLTLLKRQLLEGRRKLVSADEMIKRIDASRAKTAATAGKLRTRANVSLGVRGRRPKLTETTS